MKEYFSVLKNCSLLKNIEVDNFTKLFACVNAKIKTYSSNEYVFIAGDKINYIGIVLSGAHETHKENLAGTKHILNFLGPSSVFAEGIVCLAEGISPVTIKVKENSKILTIPFDRIVNTCGNSCAHHIQLIKNIMLHLSEKNLELNQKIELLTLKGIREKLATYLLYEAKRQNKTSFEIVPNRNELSEFLNVSRPSMCRELSLMKSQGVLDYYQNTFKILSFNALEELLVK